MRLWCSLVGENSLTLLQASRGIRRSIADPGPWPWMQTSQCMHATSNLRLEKLEREVGFKHPCCAKTPIHTPKRTILSVARLVPVQIYVVLQEPSSPARDAQHRALHLSYRAHTRHVRRRAPSTVQRSKIPRKEPTKSSRNEVSPIEKVWRSGAPLPNGIRFLERGIPTPSHSHVNVAIIFRTTSRSEPDRTYIQDGNSQDRPATMTTTTRRV